MVSFKRSKCPQLCFSATVNSVVFKGDLSIFSIGVEIIAVLPQLNNKDVSNADKNKGLKGENGN